MCDLGHRGRGDGGIDGEAAADLEVQVQLGGQASGVTPEGVGESRQDRQQGAVNGGQVPQGVAVVGQGRRSFLRGQLGEQTSEQIGVEHPGGFTERTDADPLGQAEPALDGVQVGGLTEGVQAGEGGVEEVQEKEADVLVVEELAVAGAVASGAVAVQPGEQGTNPGQRGCSLNGRV